MTPEQAGLTLDYALLAVGLSLIQTVLLCLIFAIVMWRKA